jgi:hypothetical protein
MKKITLILSCLLILISCSTAPVINGTEPFIVGKIEEMNNKMAVYTSKYISTEEGFNTSQHGVIILPKDWYHVGDTIDLIPKYKCQYGEIK